MEFTVDARAAGSAPLRATVTDADHLPVEVTIKDNKDGTYLCRYVPKKHVKHVVCVTYGGVVIPNFPIRVKHISLSNLVVLSVDFEKFYTFLYYKTSFNVYYIFRVTFLCWDVLIFYKNDTFLS